MNIGKPHHAFRRIRFIPVDKVTFGGMRVNRANRFANKSGKTC